MPYVHLDFDIFDEDEIMEEAMSIIRRHRTRSHKQVQYIQEFKEFIDSIHKELHQDDAASLIPISGVSIVDSMKADLLNSAAEAYTLPELERLLPLALQKI